MDHFIHFVKLMCYLWRVTLQVTICCKLDIYTTDLKSGEDSNEVGWLGKIVTIKISSDDSMTTRGQ